MNLRNGSITVRETLAYPGARELLQKHFPKIAGNPLALRLAQGWTLNQVLQKAEGHFPPEKLEQVRRELEQL